MGRAAPVAFWKVGAMMPLMTTRMITSIKPPTILSPGLARLPGIAIAPPPGGIIGGGAPGGTIGGGPPGGGGGGGVFLCLRYINGVSPQRPSPGGQTITPPTPGRAAANQGPSGQAARERLSAPTPGSPRPP